MEITANIIFGIYIIVSLVLTVFITLFLALDSYYCHLRSTSNFFYNQHHRLGTTGYNFNNTSCYVMLFMTLPFINIIGYPYMFLLLRAKS